MIQGNPNIKPENKPKLKSDIYKLSIDTVEKKKVKKQKTPTAQDIRVFEVLNYNKQ
jgi:hypothetical protein